MKSDFIRDFLSVASSRFSILFFGLIKSIILARYLGPEKNGVIATLSLYPSLFMSIGSLGISQAVTYFVGKKLYGLDEIKNSVVQIWIVTSIFCTITCFFLIRYFSNVGDDYLLLILAIIPIYSNLFITYNQGLFLGQNRISEYNQINWLPNLLMLLSTILFVLVIKWDVAGAMLALVPGPVLMMLLLRHKNFRGFSIKTKINYILIKKMLSLGIIYAVSLVVINLNYKMVILLLDKYSNNYEVGIYSKGAQLIEYMWQIPMLLSTIVFARSATSKNDRAFSLKVVQLLRLSFIVVSAGLILVYFLSPFIVDVLFGNSFGSSAIIMRTLLPGVLLMTIYKVLNMDLAGKGKPWVALFAMIPALFLNVIISYLLIPKLGAEGGAIAATCSYSLAAVLFMIKYLQTTGLSFREVFVLRKSDFQPILNRLKRK